MKIKSGKDHKIDELKTDINSKDGKLSSMTRENAMLREMIKKSMTFANTLSIKIYEYDEAMGKKNETIAGLKSEISSMVDQIFDLEMAVSKVKKEERRIAGIERKNVSVGTTTEKATNQFSFASVRDAVHCETQTEIVQSNSDGTQTDLPANPGPEPNCSVLFDEIIEESLNESKTIVVKCDSPQSTTVAIPTLTPIPPTSSTAVALMTKDAQGGDREIGYMEYLERRKNGFISKDFIADDEGMFPCPWEGCNHRSKFKWNTVNHYRRHTGEKRYKCDYCPRRFYDSQSCKNHVRTHTGEKPFNCPDCDFKAGQLGSIYQHRRNHCPNRANKRNTPASTRKTKATKPRVRLSAKKRKRVEEVDTESDEEIILPDDLE